MNRGWRYRTALVLLTLLLLIPQAYCAYPTIVMGCLYGFGTHMYPSIPGFTANNVMYSSFSHAPMWQGRFVRVRPNDALIRSRQSSSWSVFAYNVHDYVLEFSDPEIEQRIGDAITLKQGYYRPIVLDDRLFLVGSPSSPNAVSESYEFVEGRLKPFDFIWPGYNPVVLIKGKLFRIQAPPAVPKPVVETVASGIWTSPQEIVLPSFANPDSPSSVTRYLPKEGFVQCLNDGERIYTFLRSDGKLYCRNGLTLRASNDPNETITYGLESPDQGEDTDLDGLWHQVQDKSKVTPHDDHSYVEIIDGGPAALIVEDVESHRPVGHLYKFDGTEWNELTNIRFPFGSEDFRLLSPGKELMPYIVATTSTGTGFVYRWESEGLTEVGGQGPENTWKYVKQNLIRHLKNYGLIVGLGFLPCLAIWVMTSIFTRAEYCFGLRTVRLASLGRRAFAKIIDLALLATLSVLVALILLRNVNWFEAAEAWNLKLAHPDVQRLIQAVYLEVITLASASICLVVVQGIWGVTPGKWICGLRTLRTTLRSCGIARSLAREVLLAIDAGYLLWWIPGSLSIGLTDRRQRLGDLVGDTIVVSAKSLKSTLGQNRRDV